MLNIGEDNTKAANWMTWLGLLLVVFGSFWLRYHLFDVPLERDEGEYAYGGMLLLEGIAPYTLLYNMKLPGIYAVYAAIIAFFGQSHTAVHLGLAVINMMTAVVIYLLGARVVKPIVGLSAAAIFVVLSIGQPVQGIFANAEHFVLLPALIGALVLLTALTSEGLALFVAAGLMFGIGFIIKQHGIVFCCWAVLYLVWDVTCQQDRQKRRVLAKLLALTSGMILPYLLICLLLLRAGVIQNFWLWTIEYGRSYAAMVPWEQAWESLLFRVKAIAFVAPLAWLFALAGVLQCFFPGRKYGKGAVFLLSFCVFSILAVCPGGYFRPHYFVLLLPAASLVAGSGINGLVTAIGTGNTHRVRNGLVMAMLTATLVSSLFIQRQFLFAMTPEEASRETYWPNPFVESLEIAEMIKKRSHPEDRMAVIGSEPQLYFYTGLKSASGHVYMYPLMEKHDLALSMQQNLIKEVEAVDPRFLVFVRVPYSWLQRPDSHTLIYDWFTGYKQSYERIGLVEISEGSTSYSWTPDIPWPPTTSYWIEVLQKREKGS